MAETMEEEILEYLEILTENILQEQTYSTTLPTIDILQALLERFIETIDNQTLQKNFQANVNKYSKILLKFLTKTQQKQQRNKENNPLKYSFLLSGQNFNHIYETLQNSSNSSSNLTSSSSSTTTTTTTPPCYSNLIFSLQSSFQSTHLKSICTILFKFPSHVYSPQLIQTLVQLLSLEASSSTSHSSCLNAFVLISLLSAGLATPLPPFLLSSSNYTLLTLSFSVLWLKYFKLSSSQLTTLINHFQSLLLSIDSNSSTYKTIKYDPLSIAILRRWLSSHNKNSTTTTNNNSAVQVALQSLSQLEFKLFQKECPKFVLQFFDDRFSELRNNPKLKWNDLLSNEEIGRLCEERVMNCAIVKPQHQRHQQHLNDHENGEGDDNVEVQNGDEEEDDEEEDEEQKWKSILSNNKSLKTTSGANEGDNDDQENDGDDEENGNEEGMMFEFVVDTKGDQSILTGLEKQTEIEQVVENTEIEQDTKKEEEIHESQVDLSQMSSVAENDESQTTATATTGRRKSKRKSEIQQPVEETKKRTSQRLKK